jgi:hypothetical protein
MFGRAFVFSECWGQHIPGDMASVDDLTYVLCPVFRKTSLQTDAYDIELGHV